MDGKCKVVNLGTIFLILAHKKYQLNTITAQLFNEILLLTCVSIKRITINHIIPSCCSVQVAVPSSAVKRTRNHCRQRFSVVSRQSHTCLWYLCDNVVNCHGGVYSNSNVFLPRLLSSDRPNLFWSMFPKTVRWNFPHKLAESWENKWLLVFLLCPSNRRSFSK